MTAPKYRVVHQFTHHWICDVIREVTPAEFQVDFWDRTEPGATQSLLPQADFVVCLSLDAEEAQLLDRCRLVMHNGVGYDAIATHVLKSRGIPLALTPAMTPEGVSEHVFALTLALLKNLVPIQVDMADGNWNMFGWRERGRSLHGRTLGIVGLGRIGKRVAALGHAFGCKLIYNDLVPAPEPLAAELDLERCELDEVLARADILTVHVPLTNLTRRLFQRASFDQMKPDAIFINTSRGGTYVMDDLHAALLAGRPGAAGLDVFLPEPPLPDHPLLSLPNVIVSPHIASGTIERQYAVNRAQFENCQQVLAGLPIHNQVQL